MSIDPTFTSFADAYSDAVVAFVHGGNIQSVIFERKSNRFSAYAVEEGVSPTDVDVYVGNTWERRFPNLGCSTNKYDPNYSTGLLKAAVAKRLLIEEWALVLCNKMQRGAAW